MCSASGLLDGKLQLQKKDPVRQARISGEFSLAPWCTSNCWPHACQKKLEEETEVQATLTFFSTLGPCMLIPIFVLALAQLKILREQAMQLMAGY